MTEIPEHLLKRSRDRRNALGLGGGDSGASDEQPAGASATPAPTAAVPAPAAPAGPAPRKAATPAPTAPPPKPDSAVVAAAKRRHKIPFWAMAALSIMPLWVFMYVRAMTSPPEVVAGPMGAGAEVYSSSCQSCHGADGEGGAGRQFNEGEVELTFPHIEDQLRFVYFGTDKYVQAGVEIYGDPNRPGGPHHAGDLPGGMPAQGGVLTDAAILEAVCHERFGLPGSPSTDEGAFAAEYENWCSVESPVYAALEAGTALADLDTAGIVGVDGEALDIIDIGTTPAEGHSAD